MAKKSKKNEFEGCWRITWMDQWDQDYVDEEVEGFIEFDSKGLGSFQFGYVQGQIDYRPANGDSMMKYADIHLPYFKQGDDLHHHLEHCETVEEALEAHARQLDHAAQILRNVREMIAGQGVSFDADTHMIQVSGPDEIIEALIDAKYASRPWHEEDEYEEADEDGDEPEKRGWDAVF